MINTEKLMGEIVKLKKVIRAYESFESNVEYAMHKVGWNNSRIESAYDDLQDKLKEIEGGK